MNHIHATAFAVVSCDGDDDDDEVEEEEEGLESVCVN